MPGWGGGDGLGNFLFKNVFSGGDKNKKKGWRRRGREGNIAELESFLVRWRPNHELWMDGRLRDRWKTQSEIVFRRQRGTKYGDEKTSLLR